MSDTYAGHYPIERREGEIERLRIQAEAMAPFADSMLSMIGVREGWSCLDVGCGPGGITTLMSQHCGPSGRVVGLDMDPFFLDVARSQAAPNITFEQGDAYGSNLPDEAFDLVHMRFVASTAGNPERLLAEAKRLVKPGGVVALQEPDGTTLNCYPPHASWDALKAALLGAFRSVGADLTLAGRLYHVMCGAGLCDVEFRPFLVGVRSTDPMVDYLPATVESLRGTVIANGLLSEADLTSALNECRMHLAQSGTSFTMYWVAQVWGRKPN